MEISERRRSGSFVSVSFERERERERERSSLDNHAIKSNCCIANCKTDLFDSARVRAPAEITISRLVLILGDGPHAGLLLLAVVLLLVLLIRIVASLRVRAGLCLVSTSLALILSLLHLRLLLLRQLHVMGNIRLVCTAIRDLICDDVIRYLRLILE